VIDAGRSTEPFTPAGVREGETVRSGRRSACRILIRRIAAVGSKQNGAPDHGDAHESTPDIAVSISRPISVFSLFSSFPDVVIFRRGSKIRAIFA
jgi:hypothetical protein